MKKLIYTFLFAVTLSVTCSSCVKDCYNCSIGADSSKLCESDYASKKVYLEQLKITKALGYTCKATQ
jgi:hypothetical protein